MQLLNGCSRGDDVSYRDGRQITCDSVELSLSIAPASAGTPQVLRVALVFDRQAQGVAPTFAQLYNGASVTAPPNRDNTQRFVFLYDKMFSLGPVAVEKAIVVKKTIRVGLETQYNVGDTASITDIVAGSLYLVVVGSNTSGTTAATCYGWGQLNFHDF